jgi:hypothetical protein
MALMEYGPNSVQPGSQPDADCDSDGFVIKAKTAGGNISIYNLKKIKSYISIGLIEGIGLYRDKRRKINLRGADFRKFFKHIDTAYMCA